MQRIWIAAVLTPVVPLLGLDTEKADPVDVVLEDQVTPAKLLGINRNLVSAIFMKAGVGIRWLPPSAGQPPQFHVRVVDHAPSTVSPEAMASTRIDHKSITVYSDRVQRQVGRAHPAIAKVALAYVMAHELAHAMQGVPRHSESGIMKAQWTNDDFTAMLFGRLEFSPNDLVMIRNGRLRELAGRSSRSVQR